MTRRHHVRRAAVVCTLLFAASLNVAAAGPLDSRQDIVDSGQHLYQLKCAVCHGVGAKGDGPYANLLTKQPSDLTGLAERNGGEFPLWQVYDMISGNELMPAHGSRDMPIWGQELTAEARSRGIDEKSFVRGRIFSMIGYLLSIQQP